MAAITGMPTFGMAVPTVATFVLGINNPLSTSYVVQASLHKDTVFWSLKILKMSVILFCLRAIFLRKYDFLRYETKFNPVVDLK